MNAWEELILRCAHRRREQLTPLSDEGYAELLIAVRDDPVSFVDSPSEQAMLEVARALDAYRSTLRDDDLLDDDEFQAARLRRLSLLAASCAQAAAVDEGCLDARLLELLASNLEPDPLLEGLLSLERDVPPAQRMPGADGDAWDDVFRRPALRLRAAIARTCLEGARFRMAARVAGDAMDEAPSDPLGCRHTCALALARLEDEAAFDALDARFSRRGDAWSHLARVLLLYKLNRMPAARRALNGFDGLCEGGAYALLRPTFVELYLPDRPETAAGSFEESMFAVHEGEPIIADVPDFIGWCQGSERLVASAASFAEKNDLEW